MQRRRLQRLRAMPDVMCPPKRAEGAKSEPVKKIYPYQLAQDYQAKDPDHSAEAIKVLAEIMRSGKSETSRVAAAKLLLGRGDAKVKSLTEGPGPGGTTEIVVHYIVSGEEPPLAEGDYDTSEVDDDAESDEPNVIVKDCE
jgi:hypothetical protein